MSFDNYIIDENALYFYGKMTKKNKKVLCNLHKTLENIGEFEEDNLYYSSMTKAETRISFPIFSLILHYI